MSLKKDNSMKKGFKRLFLLGLLVVVSPVLFLSLAELLLALCYPGLEKESWDTVSDPYFTFTNTTSIFTKVDINNEPHYRITHHQAYADRNTYFPVKKGPDTIRIFCLGGSASAGWPHHKEDSYPYYLSQALKEAFPQNKIEVIDVGAHTYASYRVRFILTML